MMQLIDIILHLDVHLAAWATAGLQPESANA